MRLLLPLVCGLLAASAWVAPVRAEGDGIVVESHIVQPAAPDAAPSGPVLAPLPVAALKAAVVLSTTPALPAGELVAELPHDRRKADTLRGSVLMILLPNLCCR